MWFLDQVQRQNIVPLLSQQLKSIGSGCSFLKLALFSQWFLCYEVDYHFVREKVLNCDILVKFISTDDQTSDIYTKGLSSQHFLKLKSKLMVVPPHINLRGHVKVCADDNHDEYKSLSQQDMIWSLLLIT